MKEQEKEIITGLILSDAHLRKPKPHHRVYMSLTLKHIDFANSIRKNLPSLSWGKNASYSYYDKRKKNRVHELEYVNKDKILIKEMT